MDIDGRTVWQHAAGDQGHNHVTLCLKWDVIITGPGTKSWCDYSDDEKRKERAEVRRLCEEMRTGDIVVLKMGLSRLHGIGVVGDYEFVEEFNDIDGWELGHARRVRWLYRDRHDFKTNVFTRSTTTRLNAEMALAWIRETLDRIDDDGSWSDVEPLNFPANDGGSFELAEDELAAYLFEKACQATRSGICSTRKARSYKWPIGIGTSGLPSTRPCAISSCPYSRFLVGRRRRLRSNTTGLM